MTLQRTYRAVATVARSDTILAWYRKLVARKFDGSKAFQGPGRPRVKRECAYGYT
jgi:putative transposase